ncbi:HsdM family class I SAM-dependent methyltransferase [Leifsonia poae]|uniref:HsdM family class I SAM-dependent methyltransferase n=1 Tax=Leifsonia poae TaxID=110933 RepID=UPI003D680A13
MIANLEAIGWARDRLRWKPEWAIPATPHDLSKREKGQKYVIAGSADLVAFADDSAQSYALQVIFEFKAPDIDAGREQLMRYLSMEPVAKLGYWTNGTSSLAIYKQHANDWLYVENAPLPHPDDDLTRPPKHPLTWGRLTVPSEAELSAALKRLVATVVVQDSRATRREDQLRELLHVMLVKLDNDAHFSAPRRADEQVRFRVYGDEHTRVAKTAGAIRKQFKDYYAKHQNDVFTQDDRDDIQLTDETLYRVVAELAGYRILGDDMEVLSKAFQVFRASALKSGEGQFLTPQRVIRPCVMALEITSDDTVIDPACGTGGFIHEALRQVKENEFPDESDTHRLVTYANGNLYGADMDSIGVKLTKALMIAFGAGATHVLQGDSVRTRNWASHFPHMQQELGSGKTLDKVARKFTVVVTNPPFGENLKVSAADARASKYTISQAAAAGKKADYVDLEIGLIFLEQAFRLLQVGGRVGIVLPETYFFSFSYRWLPNWLEGRLKLRGMVNIAMEAFEEFCRAKTNFYIFEKVGEPAIVDAEAEGVAA